MDRFFSVVLFTGFIAFVMRLVAPHVRHDSAGTAPDEVTRASPGHLPEGVDPVCGMKVAANEGFLVAREGVEHRFCSLACVETFETRAAAQSQHAA